MGCDVSQIHKNLNTSRRKGMMRKNKKTMVLSLFLVAILFFTNIVAMGHNESSESVQAVSGDLPHICRIPHRIEVVNYFLQDGLPPQYAPPGTNTNYIITFVNQPLTRDVLRTRMIVFLNRDGHGGYNYRFLQPSMISGFDKTRIGIQEVTVSYLGFSTTYRIRVLPAPTPSNGAFYTPSHWVIYFPAGASFSQLDRTFLWSYGSGTMIIRITDEMISNFDNNLLGLQEATLTFGGSETTIIISVISLADVQRIFLLSPIHHSAFFGMGTVFQGESFADVFGGWVLSVDGVPFIITEDMVTGFDTSVVGVQEVTISVPRANALELSVHEAMSYQPELSVHETMSYQPELSVTIKIEVVANPHFASSGDNNTSGSGNVGGGNAGSGSVGGGNTGSGNVGAGNVGAVVNTSSQSGNNQLAPLTGDNLSISLYLLLGIASLLTMLGTGYVLKKRKTR